MKKVLSLALILAIAIALPFAFVGCKKQTVVGTWTFSGEYEYEGITESAAVNEGFVKTAYTKDNMPTITLRKDGTGTTSSKTGSTTISSEVTWTQSGNVVSVKYTTDFDGEEIEETQELIFKNGKLYFSIMSSEETGNIYNVYAIFTK